MKLEYFVKKRRVINLKSGVIEEKYIAALLEKSPMTTESICKQIEISSTLSCHEAELAIAEFSDQVLKHLSRGSAVQLGNIGWLHPKLDAKTQNNPDDVDLNSVERVRCTFRPSMDLIKTLKNASLQKVGYWPKAVTKKSSAKTGK